MLLTLNVKRVPFLTNMSCIIGDLSRILMSLLPPGSPKKACQIQSDWFAIASKMTLMLPLLSSYWRCGCKGNSPMANLYNQH